MLLCCLGGVVVWDRLEVWVWEDRGVEFLGNGVGRRKYFCNYLDFSGVLGYICVSFSWLLSLAVLLWSVGWRYG